MASRIRRRSTRLWRPCGPATNRTMRFLKTVARLVMPALVVSVAARWAAIQLRRIVLQSTDDTTSAIEPDQVAAKLRRVVVSDLHLGMGDRLDDFDADAEL